MPFQVTSTGIEIETEQEILDRLAAQARSTISPSLDVSQNSVIGRLLAIFAQEVAQNQEVAQSIYTSGTDQASGQSLDNRSALTGTTRRDATFSTVTATVNMDASTSVTAGQIIASVNGNPDALFANVEAFTSPGSPATDDHELEFIALTAGPVQAPSGTLTELEVTITGVNSITNALDADPGENQESDSALRIRRRAELTAQGTGTEDSIKADVLQVDDVEFVNLLVNRTSSTDSNGLPPHAFEVVVFGGDNTEIAQAIWDGMPSGINNFGSSSATATDDGGNSQTVYFSRPTEIRVYVDVFVTTNPDTYGGDTAVKEAIANFTNGSLELERPDGTLIDGSLGVGDDVIISQLYSAIFTVTGVEDVTLIEIGTSPSPSGTSNIAIGEREIVAVSGTAGIQTVDITVTSV